MILIHSLSSGGAERVAVNLANYWAEKGWQITVVTISGKNQDFYSIHDNIHRIGLCLDSQSAHVLDAVKFNYQRIKALRRVLKERKPDIALGFMTTANILLALAARGLKISPIGSERTYPPMLSLGKYWEWLRKKTYRYLDVVAALTRESAVWLKKNTEARRVTVIPNPVIYPLGKNPPIVKPQSHAKGKFTLLAVGRLSEEKGFDRLLHAFEGLAPCFPDWKLVILGEGDSRNSLEQLTRALGLGERVFFPGRAGNIADWYEIADIYVMTSHFEGFPNTLVEAMSYGVPAVSVDCNTGPRDIIRHGVDGLLVPQDDQAALVDALRKFMEDDALRQRYSKRAVEVRERFSMERVVQKWESLFHELIS